MKTSTRCTFQQVHSFKLFWVSLLIFDAIETSAHTIVLSMCKLKYEDHGWCLYFQQKTRPLRDAIYHNRADLKGINLNSEAFLNETSKYIRDNFTLKNNDKLLKFTPKYLKYNGLNFEGQFLVEGLLKQPDELSIFASGFDVHEHAMKILSIQVEEQEYLYNFNKEQKQITFSFDSKKYISSENSVSKGYTMLIYGIAGALMIFMIIRKKIF